MSDAPPPPSGARARPAKKGIKIIPEGFGHGHGHEDGNYGHAASNKHGAVSDESLPPPPPQGQLDQPPVAFDAQTLAESSGHGDGYGEGHGNAHNGLQEPITAESRLLVTILTGCHETRDASLLKYITNEQKEKKLCVIRCDFGKVIADETLVDLSKQMATFDNGCIGCTVPMDLFQPMLVTLCDREHQVHTEQFDGLIIQLEEGASLASVVQTIHNEPGIRESFYIKNLVALVDAQHAIDKLNDNEGAACAQIAFSSVVLLNHVDSVPAENINKIEARIKELNSTVNIVRCEPTRVDISRLFIDGDFTVEQRLARLA